VNGYLRSGPLVEDAMLADAELRGHGGADMLEAEVEKGADRYAFALAHTAGP
jgi:hypothetical protein